MNGVFKVENYFWTVVEYQANRCVYKIILIEEKKSMIQTPSVTQYFSVTASGDATCASDSRRFSQRGPFFLQCSLYLFFTQIA